MPLKIFYSENADVYPGIIARNLAFLEYERFIHQNFYPYSIHPFSSFWVNWMRTFLVVIFLRISLVPFICVMFNHEEYLYQVPLLIFHLLNILDMVVKFFVGYVEPTTEVAVLDPRLISRRYLRTYFLVDFLPCIPFELFSLYVFDCGLAKEVSPFYSECHAWMDLTSLVVLLRLISFVVYCKSLGKLMLWNNFLLGLLYVSVIMYTILQYASNFQVILYIFDENGSTVRRVEDFTSLPFKEKIVLYSKSVIELILECLFHDPIRPITNSYIRGIILFVTFYSSLLFSVYFIKYVLLKMDRREKILDMESRVVSFMRKRQLPSSLGYKTLLYCRILLENRFHREDEIFNYIPDMFKADIFFHFCLPLMKNFPAFEELPMYVLRRLAEALKYQLHLPNELVMTTDEQSIGMYFVQRGTVALYSAAAHVELYHFEAGSSFNGRNLILRELAKNTYAISIEVTEVYRLDEEDFFDVMSTYPQLLKSIQEKFPEDDKGRSEHWI